MKQLPKTKLWIKRKQQQLKIMKCTNVDDDYVKIGLRQMIFSCENDNNNVWKLLND